MNLSAWMLPDGSRAYLRFVRQPEAALWTPEAGRVWARMHETQRQLNQHRKRRPQVPPATGHRVRHREALGRHLFLCRSCDWNSIDGSEETGLRVADAHTRSTVGVAET